MEPWRNINLVVASIAIVVIMMATLVSGGDDRAKDKEECSEQVVGLATCLPYVRGQAKSPTPDCCTGLKEVLVSDKKCLCVLIKYRDDPELGLEMNVSLALGLPSVCHTTADVTKCPALLHLDPKSPEAQVFYQLAKGSNKTSTASAPTGLAPEPTSMSPTAGSGDANNNGRATSLPGKNHAQSLRKQWLGLDIFGHFFVILSLFVFV